MSDTLAAVAVGAAFGLLLQHAGLSRYDRIVNVFRFRDLAVLKFLLSALVVGAVGVELARRLGAPSPPVPSTFWIGNLVGGTLFGVGMAWSGFCPGTVAAGAGEGRLDYLVPGMLGLVTGALLFGALYPRVVPLVAKNVQVGATLPGLLGVSPWLVVLVLAEVTGFLFYVIERFRVRSG